MTNVKTITFEFLRKEQKETMCFELERVWLTMSPGILKDTAVFGEKNETKHLAKKMTIIIQHVVKLFGKITQY